MNPACVLPPRRNLIPVKISKQHFSPLQILLQMGFQKHRAEKALAATGHRSAQLAVDWLLAHVNDPTLDLCFIREYILYACPYGDLLQQLELFWQHSFEKCGWNGALNFMPHVTLVSFFKAPDECSQQIVQTLEHVVKQELLNSKNSEYSFIMEPYLSSNFIGLFVSEENSSILKRIALQYVKEVSNAIINDNYEQLDAITTCFPWCTNASSRFSIIPKHMQSISLEPHVKSLHLTLAYQFLPEHFEMLKQLSENVINTNLHPFFEIRLYSRDSRAAGKQVYKVIYSYIPKESDELELGIGDFIYVSNHVDSSDGWVEGTSWLTGNTGFFPLNYTVRTAESDSWTLHKSVPLFESDIESGIKQTFDTDNLCKAEIPLKNYGNINSYSPSSGITSEMSDTSMNNQNIVIERNLYVMRHGERVDVTFGNWIPICIGKDGHYTHNDLNMPVKLPKRHGYPNSFKDDTPLTNVGIFEAKLTGEALAMAGVNIQYAFCSPSLRCVQTCHAVLTGLGITKTVPIKIEPGLFEWLKWYIHDYPDWMTETELIDAGFKIDQSYIPFICKDKLKEKIHETCSQYYERHFHVVQNILKLKGIDKSGGNVLIVAHASSLDTCSRQLIGLEPRNEESLKRIMLKIPYCSLVKLHSQNNQWKIVEAPIPSICHAMNKRFDYKILINPDE